MIVVLSLAVVAAWIVRGVFDRWNEGERVEVAVRAAIEERDRMHARRVHPTRPAYAKRLEDLVTDAHPETVTN